MILKKIASLIPHLLIILALAAYGGFISSKKANAKPNNIDVNSIQTGRFDQASVIFPVKNVYRDGNRIFITIIKDALTLQNQSKKVNMSVMQKISHPDAKICPIINSSSIDKEIKNYNPITGRAEITAEFSTIEMAQAAVEANCLLIKNTEK